MEFEILLEYNIGNLDMIEIAKKYGKSISEVVEIIHHHKVEKRLNITKGK